MKFPNFLIHTFAAVGVISLIFWGCAAADSDNIDNIDNPPQLTGGTYQVSLAYSGGVLIMAALNTETGITKTYRRNTSQTTWDEHLDELTFTH